MTPAMPPPIGDLTGRTAIVTGANSGIGFHEAKALAEHGADVVLAVRNVDAGREAAGRLTGATTVERLDLASLESVRDFAGRLGERCDERGTGIDLLVNNGGVMAPPRRRVTADGHELQFGTNHLGHFALTGLLLPRLLAAPAPRVTTVASLAHQQGDARVLQANAGSVGYNPSVTYGQSKLANLLFAMELGRRAAAAGSALTSTAAHPGVTNTNLFASPDGIGSFWIVRTVAPIVMGMLFPSPERGAEAILYAALAAPPGSYSGPTSLGESRGPVGAARMSRFASDPDLARALWEKSEHLTGVTFDWPPSP